MVYGNCYLSQKNMLKSVYKSTKPLILALSKTLKALLKPLTMKKQLAIFALVGVLLSTSLFAQESTTPEAAYSTATTAVEATPETATAEDGSLKRRQLLSMKY